MTSTVRHDSKTIMLRGEKKHSPAISNQEQSKKYRQQSDPNICVLSVCFAEVGHLFYTQSPLFIFCFVL